MTITRKILLTLLSLAFFACKTSQTNEKIIISSENNWNYFELENDIEAKIIDHLPAPALCGDLAFASVTIIETKEKEKIRILDLCNNSNYNKNQIVKVLTTKKPEFNVMVPHRMFKNQKTKQYEYFESDLKILKTAFDKIEMK